MIKCLTRDLLSETATFIAKMNETNGQMSAFCSKNMAALLGDLEAAMSDKHVYVYLNEDRVVGALMLFQTPSNDFDVIGPFAQDENVDVALALLLHARREVKSCGMTFFFKAQSAYYLALMEKVGAKHHEFEYHLLLEESDFLPASTLPVVKKAEEKDKALVKKMHDAIFNNVYITSNMLLEPKRYNHVYLYEDKGYALMMPKEDTAYLEVFGLVEAVRGQGLAKPFLSAVIEEGFKGSIKRVHLIVDVVNERALNLYLSMGFKVKERLVSYTL